MGESRIVNPQCQGGRPDTCIRSVPNNRAGPSAAVYQAVPVNECPTFIGHRTAKLGGVPVLGNSERDFLMVRYLGFVTGGLHMTLF